MSDQNQPNRTDTLNWDTVFAIPVPNVNAAIVSQKSSPSSFTYVDEKGDRIYGLFGDWQIVQGGDGGNIRLSIPVEQVQGTCELGDFSWAKGELIIGVRLHFLPHTNTLEDDPQVRAHELKVKTTSSDPTDPVVSLKTTLFTEPITGSAVDFFGTDIVESVVPSFIIAWLNDHLEDFEHVFATVNINEIIDQDAEWAWCKPSYTDYSYSDGSTLEESILGVLCMTGGRTNTISQIQEIDRYVIPAGSIAGYLIAPERFLEDLLLPTIPLKWTNSTIDDYEIVVGGDTDTGKYEHVLQLKQNRRIKLDPVDNNGNTYTPYMTDMKISVEDDLIILEAHTETEVSLGITAWNKSTHWYTIELGENDQGQTLVYREYKEPVSESGTEAAEGIEILEWIIIAAGAIAFGVLVFVTDGAALVVGGLVIGLLTGLAAATPKIIEAVNTNTSPSLELLSFNTTDPIRWNSSDVFSLNYAGLNGPLQLGGNPNFTYSK